MKSKKYTIKYLEHLINILFLKVEQLYIEPSRTQKKYILMSYKLLLEYVFEVTKKEKVKGIIREKLRNLRKVEKQYEIYEYLYDEIFEELDDIYNTLKNNNWLKSNKYLINRKLII